MTSDNFITIRPSPAMLDWPAHRGLMTPVFDIDADRPTDFIVEFASKLEHLSSGAPRPAGEFYSARTLKDDGRWVRIAREELQYVRTSYVLNNWDQLSDCERLYFSVFKDPLDPSVTHPSPAFIHGAKTTAVIERMYRGPALVAASRLPSLSVQGNELRAIGNKERVFLRGVNVSGLQYRRFFHGPPSNPGEHHSVQPEPVSPAEVGAIRNTWHWPAAAGMTDALFDELQRLGVTVVRVTLNQEWAIQGYSFLPNGLTSSPLPFFKQAHEYLDDVDTVIEMAASRNMYVVLALHTLRLIEEHDASRDCDRREGLETALRNIDDHEDAEPLESLRLWMKVEEQYQPYNAHLPDQHSWLFWSILACRYRGVAGIIFDLCNEPHPPKHGCLDQSQEFEGVRAEGDHADESQKAIAARNRWYLRQWQQIASDLEQMIHSIDEGRVLMIAGFASPSGEPVWSSSLQDMPIRREGALLPNVVYKAHFYRGAIKGDAASPPDLANERGWRFWLKLDMTRELLKLRPDLKGQSPLGREAPFFIGEWGIETAESVGQHRSPTGEDEKAIAWGESLTEFFETLAKETDPAKWEGLCGWAAWSTFDKPCIFQRGTALSGNPNGSYVQPFELTDFGKVVKRALRMSGAPLLRPQR